MTPILASALAKNGSGPNDEAKALVIAELARIVKEGGATITTRESGIFELRFATGEVFHLGEKAVTRVA